MSRKSKTIQLRILQPTTEIRAKVEKIKEETGIKTTSKLFLHLVNSALTNEKTAPPA